VALVGMIESCHVDAIAASHLHLFLATDSGEQIPFDDTFNKGPSEQLSLLTVPKIECLSYNLGAG
jgi:hypothetical protein